MTVRQLIEKLQSLPDQDAVLGIDTTFYVDSPDQVDYVEDWFLFTYSSHMGTKADLVADSRSIHTVTPREVERTAYVH